MSWRVDESSASPVTYKNQVRGWLSYAFASEVFVIVSLTLFLPICLEQFARDNGYYEPDHITRCAAAVLTAEKARCVIKIGWVWIDTASFSLYTNSISVALQALTVISVGNVADHPRHRKRLLLLFAFIGAISAMVFFVLPSSSPIWPVSSLLAIISNVCFGASMVALNAYLPSLARNSEEVAKAAAALANVPESTTLSEETDESENAGLLSSGTPVLADAKAEYSKALATATSRISSKGIATGYLAGIILLIVALIPVTKLNGSTLSLRLAIGMSGVWWGFFSLPAIVWLPSGSGGSEVPEKRAVWREMLVSWKRLGGMLRWEEIKKLRNTFKYLAAWFLLSDGFTTITSTAVLFSKTVLFMPASSLILIGVIVPTFGIIGSLAWPYFQRRLGLSNLRIVMILVVLASLAPAYGCLGFLPVFRRIGFGGMNHPSEMYGLAVYFGFVYGAFQAYARAFYAELIPKGDEAKWYALYSITDKSSSFVGPLAVGLIADLTGNIRYGFFFVVLMIWLAVPILMSVDIERGRVDAEVYSYRANYP
ncbi:autophagy-related protein 22-like protein [Thelephora terrestris]|uniref:Autophagy-related protein n=1 Tax=Thelephora terrestris TaxID=56493 RepID=A0A9P6HJU6_9AGAM|nr:autophagy-related protein 22-like protein [Thelephora terrestris]